ncbi:MAG: protein kinase [Labilithrix sp.]|nr:protein kinase [Labilithrix sp.]
MSGVRPGDVIAGKFQIERLLGEGGMGYVVAARHLQLGQMVALKFMRDEVCTPDYKSRFLREARNTVRLKSKHVSRVLDVGSLDSGSPYMVMEYLEGTDLSDLLHKRGPVPVNEACEYVLQACEAIYEAHGHGIVHRDLKPANLFLTRGQGGEPVVKVLDFGVSKVLDLGIDDDTSPGGRPRHDHPDSVVTKATDLLGSPSYMAPEQIISARDADPRSDVWSLGVILFRLVSGKAPFQATSLGELIQSIMHGPIPNLRDAKPDVPAGLEHVVARCMERDRDRRLNDVSELARLLAPYAGPVATPSLERIAILGPALVASVPPQSHTSVPSFNSSGGGSAWTTGPVRPSLVANEEKRELSTSTAIVWGFLFVGIVACTAMLVATFAKLKRDPAPPTVASTVPSDPVPLPMTPPELDPPAPAIALTVTPAASVPVVPKPSHGHGGRRGGKTPPPPGTQAAPPDAIPATRE